MNPMNTGFAASNFGSRFPATAISRAPQTPTTPTLHAGASSSTGGQAALWANTRFSNDRDGKMAEKFRRLMGCKSQGKFEVINMSERIIRCPNP